MLTLAQMREKLLNEANRSNKKSGRGVYPFWDIPEGKQSKIRFLPDGDSSNPFFWVEKQQINLVFNGLTTEMGDKPIKVSVPCMEMWNETCPIMTETRPWWKSTDQRYLDMAKLYYKKRSYYFQGFVVEEGIVQSDENQSDNPIRKFYITSQLFKTIKDALMDNEIDCVPVDYDHGLDFYIAKTTKGGFADYSTSKWARRESALTQQQRDDIEAFGLTNLSELLPKKPTPEHLAIIYEMFEASVAGQPYDPARWARYYKPFGFEFAENADTALLGNTLAGNIGRGRTESESDEPPFEVDVAVNSSATTDTSAVAAAPSTPAKTGDAKDILDMIRRRS